MCPYLSISFWTINSTPWARTCPETPPLMMVVDKETFLSGMMGISENSLRASSSFVRIYPNTQSKVLRIDFGVMFDSYVVI